MAPEQKEKKTTESPSDGEKKKRTRTPRPFKLQYDSVTVVIDTPTVGNVRKALSAVKDRDDAAISNATIGASGELAIEIF